MKKVLFAVFFLASFFAAKAQTDIVITEIFYNSPESPDDSLEFFEIYNKGSIAINLNGYQVTDGIVFTFPNVSIGASDYLVVAKNAAYFTSLFGSAALEWTSGGLKNSGELLSISNAGGSLVDEVDYSDAAPWPVGPPSPDGGGSSLSLCDPNSDNADPVNWVASANATGVILEGSQLYCSPSEGCPTIDQTPPLPSNAYATAANTVVVEFNEVVSNSAENGANYTGLGTINSASLNAGNESVTLSLNDALVTGIYKTVTVSNIADLAGNTMTGSSDFEVVFNDSDADLVITEIMYNNPGTDDIEFIEIYNRGNTPAIMGGYEMTDGVDLRFPEYTLQPQSFVVICENFNIFSFFYGENAIEWTDGGLNNGGELLEISNSIGEVIDSLTYDDDMPWDTLADGYGYSLTLCDAWANSSDPSNWTLTGVSFFAGSFEGEAIFATPGKTGCLLQDVDNPIQAESSVKIIPNPVSNQFQIQGEFEGECRVLIYASNGQQVLDRMWNQGDFISLENYSSGLYFLHMIDEAGSSYSARVMK